MTAREEAMVSAMAKGVSYLRVALRELTGEDDPVARIVLSAPAYNALLYFGGSKPNGQSEVQVIGVPLVPECN